MMMSSGFIARKKRLATTSSSTPETSKAVTDVNLLKRKTIIFKLIALYASATR